MTTITERQDAERLRTLVLEAINSDRPETADALRELLAIREAAAPACRCVPPHRMSKCLDCGVVRPECDTHYCQVPALKAEIARLRGEAKAEAGQETPETVAARLCPLGGRSEQGVVAARREAIADAIRAERTLLAERTRERDEARASRDRLVRADAQEVRAQAARADAAEARVRALEEALTFCRTALEGLAQTNDGATPARVAAVFSAIAAALDAKPSPAPGQESAAWAGAEEFPNEPDFPFKPQAGQESAAPPAHDWKAEAEWHAKTAEDLAAEVKRLRAQQPPPAQATAAPSPGAAREVAEVGPQGSVPPCADCGTVDRDRSACPECRKVVCRDCAERGPKAHVTCCDETAERNAPQPELLRSLVETLTTADARLAPIYSHHSGDEIARAPEGSQLGLWRDGLLALRGALALLRGERRASDKRANRHPTPPAVVGPKEGAS